MVETKRLPAHTEKKPYYTSISLSLRDSEKSVSWRKSRYLRWPCHREYFQHPSTRIAHESYHFQIAKLYPYRPTAHRYSRLATNIVASKFSQRPCKPIQRRPTPYSRPTHPLQTKTYLILMPSGCRKSWRKQNQTYAGHNMLTGSKEKRWLSGLIKMLPCVNFSLKRSLRKAGSCQGDNPTTYLT
jgi:hypothetical protein